MAGRARRAGAGDAGADFAAAPLAVWRERLAGLDACVEPVLLPEEVCRDAHLVDRGLSPRAGVLATPLRLGPPATLPAPEFGAHTRDVLAEAGLSQSGDRRARVLTPCAGSRGIIDSRINLAVEVAVSTSQSPFTEEHEAFRKSVRAWVEKELTPARAGVGPGGIFPREVFKRAGELGFLGDQPRPRRTAGAGCDYWYVTAFAEELARRAATPA